MGWFQDVIWNNVFKYAYPISFIGSICYCLLSVMQIEMTQVFINKNVSIIFNLFIFTCGFLSFASWYKTDITYINPVTSLLDLDADKTKNIVSTVL